MPDNSRNNRNIKHSQKRKANVRKVNKNSSKRPINDEEENIPKALRKNKEDQTTKKQSGKKIIKSKNGQTNTLNYQLQ